MLEALCARLNRVTEFVVGVLVAVTVITVTAQVVFRYVIESSLTWSEEVARYSFIWGIFLGTSVAVRRNQHIVVDVFVKTLPGFLQRWTATVNAILCIAFFALFTYTTVLLTMNAVHEKSSALEISIAWVYVSAVIGGVLTILHLLNTVLAYSRQR